MTVYSKMLRYVRYVAQTEKTVSLYKLLEHLHFTIPSSQLLTPMDENITDVDDSERSRLQ
jgi:hypothetical protein